ncbi:tachykinin-like peptides receptor 99D isoform X2 [Leucoraja erinacea]|nr:tachykinin-like peptides receptor 99D isoform X2 [Leucoraja erinacea]
MCHVSWFSQYCSPYVLTLTLMAITLDQYQVILNPLKPRMSLSKGILSIVNIWALASCFSLPHAIYQTLFHYVYREKIIRSHCVPAFPKLSEVFRRYYDVATFTLFYILPLVVITVAIAGVSKKLLPSKTIGAEAPVQHRRKKNTIKMIVLLVVTFALCWFPLNVYTFLLSDQFVQFNNTLYSAFHCVAVSSTCWNPFIYCWMDNRFRCNLMTLLATCGGRRRRGGKILALNTASGDGMQLGVRLEDKPGSFTENMSCYLCRRRGNNGEREHHQVSMCPHLSEAFRRLQEELGPVNLHATLPPAVGGNHRSLRRGEQEAVAEENHWCHHSDPGRHSTPPEEEDHQDDRAAGGDLCPLLVPPQRLHRPALRPTRPIQQHPRLCLPLGGREQHLLELLHLLLDGQQVPLQLHDPSGQVWGEKEERRQVQWRREAVKMRWADKPGPSTENRSFYLGGRRGNNGEVNTL